MPYADREKQVAYWRAYAQKNKERKQSQSREWKRANRDKTSASGKRYYRKNKVKIRQKQNDWMIRNYGSVNGYYSQYYAKNKNNSKAAARQWQLDHVEHRRQYMAKWWKDNYAIERARRTFYYQRNKDRIKAKVKAWIKANPGAKAALTLRRAVVKQGGAVGGYKQIRDYYKWVRTSPIIICDYCGEPVPMGQRSVDHVVPVTRGGSHTIDNFAPCHRSCNSKKNNKTAEEFREFLKRIEAVKDKPALRAKGISRSVAPFSKQRS